MWEQETGDYYYRDRMYDPKTGRFLSEDPSGFKGGLNLYNYVTNKPIMLRDPTGNYGTDKCDYYDTRCLGSGGDYYCKIAPEWCKKFPSPPDPNPDEDNDYESWPRCVRQCLQDCDKTQNKDQNMCPIKPDASTDEFWDSGSTSCHVQCYSACAAFGAGEIVSPGAY